MQPATRESCGSNREKAGALSLAFE